MNHPPRRSPRRPARPFLAAAATAALLVPAAAWAGSTLGGTFAPTAPASAGEPAVFAQSPDDPAADLPRFTRTPLLMRAAPPDRPPLPGRAAAEDDPNDPSRGPQVVPLPPALYPGLALLGLAYLRTRRA